MHIAETDAPAICSAALDGSLQLSEPSIPISAAGQSEWVGDLIQKLKDAPFGLGRGIHYWEPAWINSTGLGSACEDNILFDVDWSTWPNVTAYSRTSVNMFKVATGNSWWPWN
jgi:arabinogalactan endo-1,4-beta-galactosidase